MRLLRALPIVLLPGCLVSFNDYPLGDIEGRAGIGGSSGGGVSPQGGNAPQGGNVTSGGSLPVGEGGEGGDVAVKPVASMIDDFEDDDMAIPELDGRSGHWYTGNDLMGTQTPAPGEPPLPVPPQPARAGSQGALHTYGGPFAQWGALIGTSLNDGAYDVSRYQGIRLWVRLGSEPPNVARSVRLFLPAPGTNEGCDPCSDHFGAEVPLTSEWRQVAVHFKDLKQHGWGVPQLGTPDLAHVTSLQLGFGAGVPFDIWLDDIELF